jgi:hypothetical protein
MSVLGGITNLSRAASADGQKERQVITMKTVKNGDPVVYVDHFGKERAALVTQTWGKDGTKEYDPANACLSINVVFVTDNPAETDSYGWQTKHDTSVPHKSNQSAPGNFWFQRD